MTDQRLEPAPIACTLDVGDFKARLALIAELNRVSLRDYRRDGLRLELVYAVQAREQVLRMVRGEQACCAFLAFEVRDEPDAVRVIIEAPRAARDAADTVFEHFWAKTAGRVEPRPPRSHRVTVPVYEAPSSSASRNRVVGTTAAIAVTGALACGVCVLPFALPAAILAMSGGVLAWFARVMPWAIGIALVAVAAGWVWVGMRTFRTRRRPARSTLLTMAVATIMLAAALVWSH